MNPLAAYYRVNDQHQQTNSYHNFESPSTSRIPTAVNNYPDNRKFREQQRSKASDGNQQQASTQMTYQFMKAMEKSVSQVTNVPHFGFDWVTPDYQFDPLSPAVVHERQPEPAAVEEPPKALTPRTMKELYDALEEYVDQVESVQVVYVKIESISAYAYEIFCLSMPHTEAFLRYLCT